MVVRLKLMCISSLLFGHDFKAKHNILVVHFQDVYKARAFNVPFGKKNNYGHDF